MKKIVVAVAVVLSPVGAIAQSVAPQATEQALGQKLMQEINAGLQCSAQAMTLKQDLDKATAEVTQLKAKYETKPK